MLHLLAVAAVLALTPDRPSVELVGVASIPGDARDKSGLTGTVAGGVPRDLFGSFGSGIDFTGRDDLYLACDDRGPGDGAADFPARVQRLRIRIDPGADEPSRIRVELVATTLLTAEDGTPLTGLASAFDPAVGSRRWPRLDAEGIRLVPAGLDPGAGPGAFYLSDEYGPWIDVFGHDGRRVRRLDVPAAYAVAITDADPKKELAANTRGRQPNRGFEGLALAPDGSRLWAFPQSPLIQDGALDADGRRAGLNIRVLELDPRPGAPGAGVARHLVYRLDAPDHGVNEALAIDDHRLLILERDGKAGPAAAHRAVYLADLRPATDVRTIPALPAADLPDGVHAADKRVFLDFMDPRFALSTPARGGMPEKIEGLCFGPALPDGRRTLIVTTDNDLRPEEPTWVWAFAFDPDGLSERRAP